MKARPRSLAGRLLGIAVLSTLAALLFAGLTIGHVLERFVMRGLDDRLDAQVAVLARAVRPDGSLDTIRAIDLPAFDRPGSGWRWEVHGPSGQRWTSTPGTAMHAIFPSRGHAHDRGRDARPDRTIPGEGVTSLGKRLHFRQLSVATSDGPVVITASGPREIVEAPLHEAIVPLLASLALLGGGLTLATFVQLRFGLRPLRRLQVALGEVRAGRVRYVPLDQPSEIAPLAAGLNALIDQNAAGLAHARRHVSNLAHGLKTPLAALNVKLQESGRDPDGTLGEMVALIDGRVRHHLGRARTAAPGGMGRASTMLGPAADDLVAVLRRIHPDRAVEARVEIDPDLAVAVDPQDLDEMLGNLLENAWRHATLAIRIHAICRGTVVHLAIEDDGPGLSQAAMREALIPGRRLDERGDGHGFGLSIVEELAELNGGSLRLCGSPAMKGLCAVLALPTAPNTARG